jgi:hypothetical protein
MNSKTGDLAGKVNRNKAVFPVRFRAFPASSILITGTMPIPPIL